jgi:hypothetical protein
VHHAAGSQRGSGRVPAPLRSLVLAALLVTAAVSMVALAPSRSDRGATPPGAVDSGDATWTISGRGSGDPEPKDSRTVVAGAVVRG